MELFSVDMHVKILNSDVVRIARSKGLDGIAYVPHRCTFEDMMRRVREQSGKGVKIFPGKEIRTKREGLNSPHIMAIGLREEVPDGLGWEESIERATDAGAAIVIAHPYCPFYGTPWEKVERCSDLIDGIEVLNMDQPPLLNWLAFRMCRRFKKTPVAGSYAHWEGRVGDVKTVFYGEKDEDELVQAIRRGEIAGLIKNYANIVVGYIDRWIDWIVIFYESMKLRIKGVAEELSLLYPLRH